MCCMPNIIKDTFSSALRCSNIFGCIFHSSELVAIAKLYFGAGRVNMNKRHEHTPKPPNAWKVVAAFCMQI